MAALAELIPDVDPVPSNAAEQVVRMTAVVKNDTKVHAAALLYKGRAPRALGLHDAAVKTFTQAYRRKKDRPAELLRQIRYERALGYEAIGRRRRTRQELERSMPKLLTGLMLGSALGCEGRVRRMRSLACCRFRGHRVSVRHLTQDSHWGLDVADSWHETR